MHIVHKHREIGEKLAKTHVLKAMYSFEGGVVHLVKPGVMQLKGDTSAHAESTPQTSPRQILSSHPLSSIHPIPFRELEVALMKHLARESSH